MNLSIQRDIDDGTCTLGIMTAGEWSCQTMERPWVGNVKGISCVPVGSYSLQWHDSEAHPHTYALVNADLNVLHWPDSEHPDARTAVLIHPANWASELRGCIAPGQARVKTERWMVTGSRAAFAELMTFLPRGEAHTITILGVST